MSSPDDSTHKTPTKQSFRCCYPKNRERNSRVAGEFNHCNKCVKSNILKGLQIAF